MKKEKSKFNYIINKIKSNDSIDPVSFINTSFIIDETFDLPKEKKEILKKLSSAPIGGENRLYLSSLIIDENFNKKVSLEVESGREFNNKDFLKDKNEEVPVILGSKFKDVFKLGDTFKESKVTFKIIGFLKKGESFFNDSENLVSSIENYDLKCIVPITKEIDSDAGYTYMRINGGTLYGIKPEFKKDNNVVREIENIYKEKGYKAEKVNLEKVIEKGMEENKKNIDSRLIKGGILGIFAISTLVITMVNYIKIREREFGIRISSGASIKDIITQIIYEISILIIIAFTLEVIRRIYDLYVFKSFKFLYVIGNTTSIYGSFDYNFLMIFKTGALLILICFISCIIPVLKIKDISIKDLIRGL